MDHEQLTAQLASITGADPATCRFHLEAAAWNLELATANFFDSGHGAASPLRQPASGGSPVSTPIAPSSSTPGPSTSHGSASHGNKPAAPAGGGRSDGGRRVATLGSVSGGPASAADEGQTYFAGGERSGQLVQGPPAAKKPGELVKGLFAAARAHGAEEVDPAAGPGGAARPGPVPFVGGGFRLGHDAGASQRVDMPGAPAQPEERLVVITFWKQGFTVDDQPLRRFDDPANQSFLDDINAGHIPRELETQVRNAQINVNLVDNSAQDYVPPKTVLKPFVGAGHALGSGSAAPAPAAAKGPSSSTSSMPALAVDPAKPSTSVQLRLADGTRLVARFNHDHTLADVRRFVDAARAGPPRPYILQTAMPVRPLTDPAQTLAAAGLLNATIIQKYT